MKNGKMGGGTRRGLEPLEFEECIVDSPEFRDNLTRHEKELDHTSHQIKRIIKEVKDLMSAAKVLSQRQCQLAKSLKEFNFECIGTAQTDDEMVISDSLRHFGTIIESIEDHREHMLKLANDQIIERLEDFRKKQIGGVKENKKKFDKKTEKFCQSQERFLNMSTKKPENTIQEADASLGMHEREYIQESLSYVLRIQEVQERIKFEFVEILLAFISGWLVFYHTAHEQGEDNKDYLQDLRHKVQKTRENFEEAREKVNELKSKYMEKKTKPEEKFTKRGYLFLMEKSSILKISLLEPFKATWTKYYCTYKKQKKEFTMLQFNQISGRPESNDEKLTLISCQRRASEFEKRFCFDLTFKEKPGIVYTFQALSEEDRKAWINAMDGTEPTYLTPGKTKGSEEYQLDETGFAFVRKCIEVLENRGLEEEGIYRKSGVGTKITKLLSLGMDKKKTDVVFSDEQYKDLMESNTIASALKTYLRNLNEPLMTYRYHSGFIEAAKQDNLKQRVHEVHKLVHKLPQPNFIMLEMVVKHLTEVSRKYEKNKMSVFNLGVVFGPTLLRPQEETVAAILDIKFNNIVINILIENYELIFNNPPGSLAGMPTSNSSPPARVPRTNQTGASAVGNRPSMYSPQQPVYRIVTSYTEQPISSSLQNIPNGMIYQPSSSASASSTNGTPNAKGMAPSIPVHQHKSNHHQMSHMASSESDISVRRDPSTYATVGVGGAVLTGGTNCQLVAHATPANATNLRHEYLTQPGAVHAYNGPSPPSNRVNISPPPPIAMRPEQLYGTTVHGRSHLNYAQTKHYPGSSRGDSNDRMHSTSSSNESVCDSVSSSRDKPRASIDYSTHQGPISVAGSVSNLLAGASNANSCDDVVVTSSNSAVSTNHTASEYVPKNVHRTKDVDQIKRDLSAGTARVRTLYACLGESEGELSFEPNQIITNVRYSHEPGWLQGTLNGKTGLIPENYVEHLKSFL